MVTPQRLSQLIYDRFYTINKAFLLEFRNAALCGDRLATAAASAKLAQVGLSMFEFFGAGAEGLTENNVEGFETHEAAILVRDVLEQSLAAWSRMSAPSEKPN